VTADAIDAGAITSDKIFADAVNSEKIAADSISSNMLQSNSVTADKIAADLITVGQGLGKESAPATCTANMRRGTVEAYNVIVKWHEDGTGGNGFAITFERNPSLSGGTASASYDSARAMTVEANGNVPVNSIVNAINAARLNGDQLVVASRQPGFTSGSNTGTFGSGVADITCSLAGGVKDRIDVTTIDGGWITTGIITADRIDADVRNYQFVSKTSQFTTATPIKYSMPPGVVMTDWKEIFFSWTLETEEFPTGDELRFAGTNALSISLIPIGTMTNRPTGLNKRLMNFAGGSTSTLNEQQEVWRNSAATEVYLKANRNPEDNARIIEVYLIGRA